MEPAGTPDGTREEIAPETAEPEETEFEENGDFEIGITIEEMRGEESTRESDLPVDVSSESVPSDHVEQSYHLHAQVPAPDDVRREEQAVSADAQDESISPDRPGTDPVLSAMAGIKEMIGERIDQLADLFETKIKVDTHKNKVIDNLHGELQTFRDGIIKKQFYSFVTDMIKVIDDVRKFKRHYDGMPPTAENMDSILNFLEGITSDIEDLFSWQGVVSFCCEDGILDTSRQRVINKIECGDPALDRMVAESVRPGYEWDGKVIRPEMVTIYMYVNNNLQEDTLADGQTD